jgi:hypothetical protein
MVEILEKELKRLETKRSAAQASLNDAGSDRYYNLAKKYEDQIFEIEKLIASGKSTALREYEFINFMTDVKSKLENLRLDYPHEEGLLIISNYLKQRTEEWIKA